MQYSAISELQNRDFPGGPVAKTLRSQSGLGLTPSQGTRSCMPQLGPSAAKSIKKKTNFKGRHNACLQVKYPTKILGLGKNSASKPPSKPGKKANTFVFKL